MTGLLLLAVAPPQTTDLHRYIGKDLRPGKAVAKLVAPFAQDPPSPDGFNFPEPLEPWWVAPYATGDSRYLLALVTEGTDVPGIGRVRVILFDSKWRKTASLEFPTGDRLRIREVRLEPKRRFNRPLLVVLASSPGSAPGSGVRQWYAFQNGRALFVRCTTGDGHPIPVSYRSSYPMTGPDVFGRTAGEWQRDLMSPDPLRQLSCLVWLSGGHLPSAQVRQPGVSEEPVGASRTYEEVKGSPAAQNRLRALRRAKDPWVREYARLVLGR